MCEEGTDIKFSSEERLNVFGLSFKLGMPVAKSFWSIPAKLGPEPQQIQ